MPALRQLRQLRPPSLNCNLWNLLRAKVNQRPKAMSQSLSLLPVGRGASAPHCVWSSRTFMRNVLHWEVSCPCFLCKATAVRAKHYRWALV